jgi:predicted nucleic acid-binding protein
VELEPVLLDTDTLSELSRGTHAVQARAAAYLGRFGRLTISSVTVFERLRAYRSAIRDGKPFERQLQAFEALVASSVVLPFDQESASVAAEIWSAAPSSRRRSVGDILIAAIAVSRHLPLVTRNRRDFQHLARDAGLALRLDDWSRAPRGSAR